MILLAKKRRAIRERVPTSQRSRKISFERTDTFRIALVSATKSPVVKKAMILVLKAATSLVFFWAVNTHSGCRTIFNILTHCFALDSD